jgi:GT2 family glycosyltransferase
MSNDTPIDLVVPIHGGLPLNRLFFESLKENTRHPFRLIVVDNHSPDASAEFFRSQKGDNFEIVVLSNERNQCYPVSMNQGLKETTAPVVGLLNNDIVFGPGWDVALVSAIEEEITDCASPMGLEHMPNENFEDFLFARWKMILKRTYSDDEGENLRRKIKTMYGDLDRFGLWIQNRYKGISFPGIMGHCHLISRHLLTEIGELDPQMESADWDLYLRVAQMVKSRKLKFLPMIVGGSFVHHFIRATKRKGVREPQYCNHPPHLKVEEKWSVEEVIEFWPFRKQHPGYRKSLIERVRKILLRKWAWLTLNQSDCIGFAKRLLKEK